MKRSVISIDRLGRSVILIDCLGSLETIPTICVHQVCIFSYCLIHNQNKNIKEIDLVQ